jgi:hypothetical protein
MATFSIPIIDGGLYRRSLSSPDPPNVFIIYA